jgi:hypothetical protein
MSFPLPFVDGKLPRSGVGRTTGTGLKIPSERQYRQTRSAQQVEHGKVDGAIPIQK